ncbi:hypothetical protein BN129_1519 [Cronobacter sakazakii 701]|nr:hypothetical protein BN129_1519 [Cronobacter sakazakii 701]
MVVDIVRVNAHQRRAFGKPVAFQQELAGEFFPALRDRLMHRHPAARRKVQRGEIELMEIFVIQQRVKQRVHAGHRGKRIFAKLFDQPRNIARVGNQHVLPAEFNKEQTVHGERENVVQRQRGDHQLFAAMQQRAVRAEHLFEVSKHVAMGQHRAFRHARSTAGILQESEIVWRHFRLDVLHAVAVMQRAAKRNSVRQVILRHQAFHVLHHKVHQRAFGGGELIAHARQNDVFHLGLIDHFFQRVRKVRNDDDGAGTAVVQLMLQLARRVERVDVHDDHSGAQNAEQRHRILQEIWHHQRHAIAFLQAQALLQPGGEGAAALFQLAEGHHLTHVGEGGLVGVACAGLLKQIHQGVITVRVYLRRNIRRITGKPNLLQCVTSECIIRRHHNPKTINTALT